METTSILPRRDFKHPRHPRQSPTAKPAAIPRHHYTHDTHGVTRICAHEHAAGLFQVCVSRVYAYMPWVTWGELEQRVTFVLPWVIAVGAVGAQQ